MMKDGDNRGPRARQPYVSGGNSLEPRFGKNTHINISIIFL